MKSLSYLPVYLLVTFSFWCCSNPEKNRSTVQDKKENEDTASVGEKDTASYPVPVTEEDKLARNHITKKEFINNEKISSTHFFNAQGKIIKKISGNYLTQYTYNPQGKLTQELSFENGKKYHEIVYTLNEKGQTVKETANEIKNGKTTLLSEKIYFYTGEQTDSIHSLLHLSDRDLLEHTKFYYDPKGRMIKKETRSKNGGPWYFSEYSDYSYDPKTGLLKTENWHSLKENGDRQFDATVEYSYNESGDLTRKVNNALGMVQSYDYDYNEQGLMVKETQVNPQNTLITIYRYSQK